MLSIIWYILLPQTFFPFTIPSRASFSRQFLLSQWPSQFLFLFLISSIPTYQMFPVVFAHSAVMSRSLHHTTLHSTQSTSLAFFIVLFPRIHRICFSPCQKFLLPLLSFASLLENCSCCYWYCTPSIWCCPLGKSIFFRFFSITMVLVLFIFFLDPIILISVL